MADLNADVAQRGLEEAAKEYKAQKAEAEVVQGPRIIEGNTGTLSVMILDQINSKLGKLLEFVEEIKQEKV